MKKMFSIFALLTCAALCFSQEIQHKFYMKDGTVFEGVILEKTGDVYKMKTMSGREILLASDQIKKIVIGETGEENLDDYGSDQSFGISLFGGGIVGVHYRRKLAQEFFLDIGTHASFVALEDTFADEVKLEGVFAVSTGLNYFINRFFKERKQKVRANGLYFHGSHGFGKYDATTLSAGWASEYFRAGRYNQSFLLELGPSVSIRHWVNDPANFPYNYNQSQNMVNVYLRLLWNFHTGKS